MDRGQTFQVSAILAAISVPLLSVVVNIDILARNPALMRYIGIAGFLFLVSALISYMELIEIKRVPQMKVIDAFKELASSKGAMLIGLVLLLIFHIQQSYILFYSF